MSRVEYKLQAYMADNDVGEMMSTRARFRLVNKQHLSRRPANPRAPQSTYTWALDDSSIIGLHVLDDHDAAKVFAIALSMQTWRFLHSPVILNTVADLKYAPGGMFGTIRLKHTSPQWVLDERSFVAAAEGLKAVFTVPEARGDILREAVNSYWDALHSVQRRSRLLSLWAAFERAVNDDGRRRDGAKFDCHAAIATGCTENDIEPLRRLTTWLKHADAVTKVPHEITENIGRSSASVKRLADRAIAARLGFALSAFYSR